MLRVRNGLWVISDTHFGHKNIIQFQQRPESHEVIMLSHWIDRVGEHDQLLHLGDVFMGKQGNPWRWAKVLSRMPGEKFLIKGNHDKAKDSLYAEAGFTIVPPFVHERIAFTHEPIGTLWNPGDFPLDSWDVNVHGHIHRGKMGDKIAAAAERHDGSPFDGKTYINVSVEETGLAPVQLGNILGRRLAKEGVNSNSNEADGRRAYLGCL